MSENEKFQEIGRAHAALKDARSSAAIHKSKLVNYSQRMEDTNRILKEFLQNPLKYDSEAPIQKSEYAKNTLRCLPSATIAGTVDDLISEMQRERDLQEQIDKF